MLKLTTNTTYQDIQDYFDSFVITGVLYRGKRFKAIHTKNFSHAMAINLWNGSVWGVKDGKRQRLKRVMN